MIGSERHLLDRWFFSLKLLDFSNNKKDTKFLIHEAFPVVAWSLFVHSYRW